MRLHRCLKSSVDGTKCAGHPSIHAQFKLYKKVLEDQYQVNCDATENQAIGEPVPDQPSNEEQFGRLQKSMKRHRSSALTRYLGKNVDMSKQVANHMGSYDDDEDYELISKRQKPVFANPAGKLVEEPEAFRNDDSYDIQKPNNYQYHEMSRRNQRELEDYEDFADLEPDMRPRAGRRQRRRHRKLRANRLVGKPLSAARADREARRAKRKKRRRLASEDEYFFDNEPDEGPALSALPDNMAMFQHIKHRPEINVQRLVEASGYLTTSTSAVPQVNAAYREYLNGSQITTPNCLTIPSQWRDRNNI